MNLKDKVVVITGSSKGFGKELAKAFLKEGSKIVINSRNIKELKEVVMEMGVLGICADVTNEEELTYLLKETVKELGGVDIWINNAGLWMPKTITENLDMKKVKNMFDVNVIGTINGTRVALRFMKAKSSGCIINVISNIALKDQSNTSSSVYGASKWAVNGFTKFIRGEDKNISILSIYPGAMKTDLFNESKPDNFDNFMDASYVVKRVIDNLKLEKPEEELIVEKPTN